MRVGIVLQGTKSLQQHFINERPSLFAAPVLLFRGPATAAGTACALSRRQEDIFKHVQLGCVSAGLRTAVSHSSSDYFPYVGDIQTSIDLAQRIGSTTLIGVGSDGAIQLAKAVAQEAADIERIILVPSTSREQLLSTASHSLVLNYEENALIPHPATGRTREGLQSDLVLFEHSFMATTEDLSSTKSTIYACVVIALDALYRGTQNEESTLALIGQASVMLRILRSPESTGLNESHTKKISELTSSTGRLLSFGFSPHERSIPLALSSALITSDLADYTLIDFVSRLLPGMYQILKDKTTHKDLVSIVQDELLPDSPHLAQSPFDDLRMGTLMKRVRENSELWHPCLDVDDSVFETVLRSSLAPKV